MLSMAMNLRLDADTEAALARIVAARGLSKADAIALAIRDLDERERQVPDIEAAIARETQRWSAVLDRLA